MNLKAHDFLRLNCFTGWSVKLKSIHRIYTNGYVFVCMIRYIYNLYSDFVHRQRSRSGKRSPAGSVNVSENDKMVFAAPSSQPGRLPYNSYVSGRHCTLPHQPNVQAMVTQPSVMHGTQTSHIDQHNNSTMPSLDDKVINNFMVSLFNAVKPNIDVQTYDSIVSQPCPIQPTNNAQIAKSIDNSCESLFTSTHQNCFFTPNTTCFTIASHTMSNTLSLDQHRIDSCGQPNNFVPLEKSSLITGGVALNMDNAISSTSNFHDSLISGIFSMDTDYSNAAPLTEMQPYTSVQSVSFTKPASGEDVFQSLASSNELCSTAVATGSTETECKSLFHPMSTDEDSLMNFLKVDVMDMGTMMEYLKPDDSILWPVLGFHT